VKITAIQTGTVAIKTRQREGVGRGKRRLLKTMLDRGWTEPLPIFAFVIEHPEGVIVVDTGETARACEPGYFPSWHPYFRFGVREWVTPDEEIGPRLGAIGISPEDVRLLVMTHLHTDHAGGLHHFPRTETLVSATELALAAGRRGRLRGYVNNRFPDWFAPKAITLAGEPLGPFPSSLPLTDTGDVLAVPLPGHTPGMIGVVVRDGGLNVLIAGDSAYSEELMLRGAIDGVAPDEKAARDTLTRIQAFVAEQPTVYVVAHDPESRARLDGRRTA
jgi:glyoxylase-like metal-dependent hydrolase (beta-lactamase superfamily II)